MGALKAELKRCERIGIVIVSLLAFNCGSSANGVSDAGVDVAATPDAAPVRVSGTVFESAGGAPIAGVTVCIVDQPTIPCAVTDPSGSYTTTLPALTSPLDIAFNVAAAGHLGVTELFHESLSGTGWPGQVSLLADASATTLLGQAGFTYPSAGTGFIQLCIGAGHVGVIPVVSPMSSTGPVFLDPTGTPDPTLEAVTSNGYVLVGNLTQGKVEITASQPCDVHRFGDSWLETKPGTVTGLVVAGSITQMTMICDNE